MKPLALLLALALLCMPAAPHCRADEGCDEVRVLRLGEPAPCDGFFFPRAFAEQCLGDREARGLCEQSLPRLKSENDGLRIALGDCADDLRACMDTPPEPTPWYASPVFWAVAGVAAGFVGGVALWLSVAPPWR